MAADPIPPPPHDREPAATTDEPRPVLGYRAPAADARSPDGPNTLAGVVSILMAVPCLALAGVVVATLAQQSPDVKWWQLVLAALCVLAALGGIYCCLLAARYHLKGGPIEEPPEEPGDDGR